MGHSHPIKKSTKCYRWMAFDGPWCREYNVKPACSYWCTNFDKYRLTAQKYPKNYFWSCSWIFQKHYIGLIRSIAPLHSAPLHSNGLAESVRETIRQRKGKLKATALKISDIVDDWRTRTMGGFVTGLFLWESCCIPFLLYNSGSWLDMSKEDEKQLDTLQKWLLHILLRQGPVVPSGAILCESAMLSMGRCVWHKNSSMPCTSQGWMRTPLPTRSGRSRSSTSPVAQAILQVQEDLQAYGSGHHQWHSAQSAAIQKKCHRAYHDYDLKMLKEQVMDNNKCMQILSEG